jgi:hypothetical protein
MAEQPAAARLARAPRRNPLLRAGLPLVGFVIFGTLALAQLVQARATRHARAGGIGGKRARARAHLRAAAWACFAGAQGKKDVQDARASATDERLPVAVRRRKGRGDLEAEHKARACACAFLRRGVA